MHDVFDVGGVQTVGDFDGGVQQPFDVHWLPGDEVLESGAVEKFHGDVTIALVLANFVDGANVGMV